MKWLFQSAYEECKAAIEYPDDAALLMAFTNKAMADVAGARHWARLLQLYEYLEPIEHSGHQEWRIVQPYPYYGYADSKQEIIKAVSPPRGWATHVNVVRVEAADVVRIICPASNHDELRARLPEVYRNVPLQCLEG